MGSKLTSIFHRKQKHRHFTAEDLFFLRIPQEKQKDVLGLIDTLYSLKFKRSRASSREKYIYIYNKGIKVNPWDRHYKYVLKVIIFKSLKGYFVPVVYVKDTFTDKEWDPLGLPKKDRVAVYKAVDNIVGQLLDEGVIVLGNED